MWKTLEAISILLIVWQLMTRSRKKVLIKPDAKNQLKEAIDDAKNRMPSTGLFQLFKEGRENQKNVDLSEIKVEQIIVPSKAEAQEDE